MEAYRAPLGPGQCGVWSAASGTREVGSAEDRRVRRWRLAHRRALESW